MSAYSIECSWRCSAHCWAASHGRAAEVFPHTRSEGASRRTMQCSGSTEKCPRKRLSCRTYKGLPDRQGSATCATMTPGLIEPLARFSCWVPRLMAGLSLTDPMGVRLATGALWRVRFLTHSLWRRRYLKTHLGLSRPLSAPMFARSLSRWNGQAGLG
jgi:hypothetical protein